MSSEKPEVRRFRSSGGRLDKQLAAQFSEFSRSRLQKLIRAGNVSVERAVVRRPGHQLEGGEYVQIEIPLPRSPELKAESIPLAIIYEDDDLLLVDKPAGMVVHPSHGHEHGTLVQAALAHAPDIKSLSGETRPGVIHRLDKDTSGLIMMAKTERALTDLQDQFMRHAVKKEYVALVDGSPEHPIGRIEGAIGRDPRHRKKMAIVPESRGRQATTMYRTAEKFTAHTFLMVEPHTGRTHQIRVHLASIGIPVVGDRTYGRRAPTLRLKRHFLHAQRLTFRLPGGGAQVDFEAPLPEDLEEVLRALRAKTS
jgi:23S rRNA pseudouridine1911/1915/1917 synthase